MSDITVGARTPSRGQLVGWRAGAVWLAIAVPLLASVACVVLIPKQQGMPSSVLLVFTLMAASLGVVGALIATRQPRNAVGWILWASSIAVATSTIAGGVANLVVPSEGPVSTETALILWASQIGLQPAIAGMIVLVPLLFPNGRVLSRRWRWVAAYGIAVIIMMVVGTMFAAGPLGDFPTIPNPLGIEALEPLRGLLEFAKGSGVMLAAVLAISSSVLRYRQAGSIERTQLRWFGAATGFTISLFFVSILASAPGVQLSGLADIGWIGGIVSLSLIPVAIGMAILRYRLYEIDRLISRTLSWAIVTGLLVGAFAALVVGLQTALASVTSENTLAVAASTLIVATLFQPLRARIQRSVDKRFNRGRVDAQRAIDAFGAQLRDEVDLVALRRGLIATVDGVVQPDGKAVWIRGAS